MNWPDELMLDMLDQGIDVSAPGLPYARRAYPDLDSKEPARAYSAGPFKESLVVLLRWL